MLFIHFVGNRPRKVVLDHSDHFCTNRLLLGQLASDESLSTWRVSTIDEIIEEHQEPKGTFMRHHFIHHHHHHHHCRRSPSTRRRPILGRSWLSRGAMSVGSNGLQPSSNGLQLIAMASSNLITMASNLIAVASNQVAMASN